MLFSACSAVSAVYVSGFVGVFARIWQWLQTAPCEDLLELADKFLVEDARIVPPTSQNQARIERDLAGIAPALLALPNDAATRRCEQLIRAYDPCISCATHFLELHLDHQE